MWTLLEHHRDTIGAPSAHHRQHRCMVHHRDNKGTRWDTIGAPCGFHRGTIWTPSRHHRDTAMKISPAVTLSM
eukprot:9452945-Pyramimonas_sp.AAC.1